MNLPNKLTLLRILIIPIIIIVSLISKLNVALGETFGITIQNLIILILFAIASFTDFLDGKIARSRNLVTDFGKFMDPLADKLLVMSALIIALEQGRFSVFGCGLGFVVIIILAREFMVTGIRLLASGKSNVVIAASKLGKYKTATQMIMIIFILFNYPNTLGFEIAKLVIVAIPFILTVVSGVDYFIKNKDIILKDK